MSDSETPTKPDDVAEGSSFTGVRRERKTRFGVKFADTASRTLITVGGIGTIVAVLAVCLYLLSVVLPLFTTGEVEERVTADPAAVTTVAITEPVALGMDQYQEMVYLLDAGGALEILSVVNGDDGQASGFAVVEAMDLSEAVFDGKRPTAWFTSPLSTNIAAGFDDGSIRTGRFEFRTEFFNFGEEPEAFRALQRGDTATGRLAVGPGGVEVGGVAERTPEAQIRFTYPLVRFDDPTEIVPGVGIRDIDMLANGLTAVLGDDGAVYVVRSSGNTTTRIALRPDGTASETKETQRENMMTGEVEVRTKTRDLESDALVAETAPERVIIDALGQQVRVVWPDGTVRRISIFRNTRLNAGTVEVIFDVGEFLQEVRTLGDTGEHQVSQVTPLLGRRTTLVAGDDGRLIGWIDAKGKDLRDHTGELANTIDQTAMLPEHDLSGSSPITALSTGSRSRLLAVGHEDGSIDIFNVTSEKQVVHAQVFDEPISLIGLAPREDGLAVLSASGQLAVWSRPDRTTWFHEVSLKAMLAQVHYEGYDHPSWHWESTGGGDDYEPKISLMPLIFGTLKATFYSMIFGAPLALLAAIYSSEFMGARTRGVFKPTIELMASLPSVVLGFLAGTIIAAFVEDSLVAVLTSFFVVPMVFVLGAHLWQMAPPRAFLLFRWVRLPLVFVALVIGIVLSMALAGPIERALFSVDVLQEVGTQLDPESGLPVPVFEHVYTDHSIKLWLSTVSHTTENLSGYASSPVAGWLLLFLPLSIFLIAFFNMRVTNPWLMTVGAGWSQQRFAAMALLRFVGTVVAVVVLAWLLSALAGLVADARGSYVGRYDQRNALVVGFVMGFAIIPIIYTIADDALTSVPMHLRSASLGCGATPWQTAMRIVVPTAMSGLFSAVMIGLGRAVGETMIVLMAAGNTPVMELNIFEGFRTLSANIAVELPEAPKGGWHYRLLFLSALVLFAFTFILNTAAEAVRLRFRKRAVNL